MKNIFYTLAISSILFAGCAPAVIVHSRQPEEIETAPEPVTYQKFYDELSPYGRWIDYPGEGYVWSPNADPGFKPYATNGHWVYSDEGWTWVSDFNWGWAPFHYGNWFYEEGNGWLWLPGTQWAPAWVTWGQSGNYYGWAPVPPHTDISHGWTPPQQSWTFVPQQHITKPHVSNYIVDNSTNVNIVKNITIINNVHNNNTTINNNVTNNVITKNTSNNITNNVNTNNHITTKNTNDNITNNANTDNHIINNGNVANNNPNATPKNPNNNVPYTVNTDHHVANSGNVPNANNNMVKNPALNNIKNIHGATIADRGPEVNEVSNVMRSPVNKTNINEYDKPVKSTVTINNKLVMYRPVVRPPQQQASEPRPMPQKLIPYNRPQGKKPGL